MKYVEFPEQRAHAVCPFLNHAPIVQLLLKYWVLWYTFGAHHF